MTSYLGMLKALSSGEVSWNKTDGSASQEQYDGEFLRAHE